MARDKFGIIPDDHFENEPTFPAKNVSPLSKYWIERIKEIQDQAIKRNAMKADAATADKYRPGDVVCGYQSPNQR